MQASDFGPAYPGNLVDAGGYVSFVPHALPPELAWDDELVGALSEAERALGRLGGIGQTLPNPHLIIGPFVRREAVLSSRIEGTHAALSDLVLFEVAPTAGNPPADVQEVANYVKALEHALTRLKEIPISLRLIREMHTVLLAGVRGQAHQPGEFRRVQNWIGYRGSTPADARYVPAPVNRLDDCLSELERFLHAPPRLPVLIRLGLVHYQFEAIHPFEDGNGRVGRLLIALLLCAERVLPSPLLYLSAYFERNRAEYYDRLLGVTQRGEWGAWLRFFVAGVADQANDGVERAGRLLALRGEFSARCQTARCSGLTFKLLDSLFCAPAITMPRAAELLDVAPNTAQANLDKLVQAGILREVTGQRRNRVYVADEIVRAVEPVAEATAVGTDA
jgi:Fic family protein